MTIESIKSEIIKLNNEVNEIWSKQEKLDKKSKNYDTEYAKLDEEAFNKYDLIDNLSNIAFEMGYGFNFYWEGEDEDGDDCEFSSSVIKIGEKKFISGDILIDSNLEIDLRCEGYIMGGIHRVFMSAYEYQIEIRFVFFKFK